MADQQDLAFERYVESCLYKLEYELRQGRTAEPAAVAEPATPKVYTQEQAARRLGMSRAMLKKLEDSKQIKRIPGTGRAARYTETELRRFENKRE